MIAVVQRVVNSSVKINNEKISSIDKGLNVLLCVTLGDELSDIYYIADKIVNLRIFPDANDKMNLSLIDVSGELIVISQFTLAADTKKGNRPSFTNAADADKANEYYGLFMEYLKSRYDIEAKKGTFGKHMVVEIVNDGPVTIIIDSHVNKNKKSVT